MNIAIYKTAEADADLIISNPSVNLDYIDSLDNFLLDGIDALFSLESDAGEKDYSNISIPVFVNSVDKTLREIKGNKNVIRINGWHGFLSNQSWEVAGNINDKVYSILMAINKVPIATADEPGFISARIIAMIVNEAFFALGEFVSSREEINIAMKLGTNYPYGPFEWADMIGLSNIYSLLNRLAKEDTRYHPAPELVKNLKNGHPDKY